MKHIICITIISLFFTTLGMAYDDGFVSNDFDAAPDICQVTMGGVPATLEVADEWDERMQGLMYRKSLPEDYGMIFIFEDEEIRRFWMKNTLIDLDIAFIDKNGIIVDIKQMKKFVERTTVSDAPAMYAVEMNAGWFFKHNVVKGDLLEFLDLPE